MTAVQHPSTGTTPSTPLPRLQAAPEPERRRRGPAVVAGSLAVGEETVRLGRELAAITLGVERELAGTADKRFADPAWSGHPGYRRLGQGYLAWSASLDRLVDRYEAGGAGWREVERARFAVRALAAAASPTNTLAGNPAALKKALETGGRSVVRGVGQMLTDVRTNGGLPALCDPTAFGVGRNLATTRGAVVYRDDVIELIQYAPATPDVHARPLLVVPPVINRYYLLDLRAGRSFIEHAVGKGFQTFVVSWRNPSKQNAHWDLDTYTERLRRAVAVMKEVTGSPDVNMVGFCAGGILQTLLLNHLAAVDDRSVHSAAYGVTLLDFGERAPIGAFAGKWVTGVARRLSRARGVLGGKSLGSVFSFMKPNDLVFDGLVSQWLQGEPVPAFDVLAWNADAPNLPARLHDQFLGFFRDNSLVQPGALTVLGSPVDLGEITVPTFVTGAITDHLTPWRGCYRTSRLLSGPSTFVLSNGGHIQSLVNPPGNPKAKHWVGGEAVADPEEWRAAAEERTGSWWETWADWTAVRSGPQVPAPETLGSDRHPALTPAPGLYVLDKTPA
ncbi:alpha/beta hydrolase [Blastococcus sp. URHD0036]|uniref:PHA/PHB synthase family protein n=1 Tax=Blastococcus sp. URHD0036 TaxID=1380356 RepID=UPI000B28503A|nr:alpha/beta fold hydrolase [Blastococcus sp. URHD0036]